MKEITNKWPAMLITGEKVTEEQAIDIIIRTDEAVVSPTYLAVHRLKGEGLTPKRIIDLVNMNEHEEYLTYFEDDRKYFEPYIKAYEVLFDDINFIWEKYKTVRDQKDFAMCVKDFPFASILFRKRKDSEQSFLHLFNLQSDPYKRDLLEKIKNTI